MKIRSGFVSNSSSSSFCLYGISADSNDLLRALNIEDGELLKLAEDILRGAGCNEKITAENYHDLLDEYEIDSFDPYEVGEALGLEVHWPDGDYVYLGRSWDDINDDETGAQFKNYVETIIHKSFTKKFDVESMSDSYYC